jgi:PAS domain S-box-containing protein
MISLLYVDDEPDLLTIARLFLEESGEFKVATLTSAQEALAVPDIGSYDVIVSDYQMPGMDGIAFLKAVRERSSDIPFILFTGRGREEVVVEAINNGADSYVQKGGDPKTQFAELSHKIVQAVARRRAERLRTESEKRLLDIINFLPDATFAIDRSGTVIAWNRAMEAMTGLSSAEMLGKGNYEYAVPLYGKRRPILIDLVFSSHDEVRKNYSFVRVENENLTAETINAKPGGKPCTLWGRAAPLRNSEGALIGAIESIRDITESKMAVELLRASEERFRSLIQNSSDMIRVLDANGLISYSSPSTLRITGFDPGDVIGKNALDYVHPDDRERVKTALDEVCNKTNHNTPTEFRIRHADGHYIDAEAVATNHRDVPAINGIISTTRPLTERREAQEKLKRSEEKYRDLAESLPQMVFELDLKYQVTYVNKHTLAVFGFTNDDLKNGINAISFIDPEEHAKAKEIVQKQLAGIPSEPQEYTALRKDGSTFPVLIYSAPVCRDKIPVGFRGIIVDISAWKKMETDLRESEKKFRTLVEYSLDGILITDVTGNILFVNQAAGQIVDMPDYASIIGKQNVLEYIAPELQADVIRDLRRVSQGIDAYLVNYKIKTETKREIWVECIGKKIPYGDSAAILVSMRDVTERRKSETALQESERKFATVFQSSPVALTLVSATDGKFVDINDAFVKNTGYSRDEVLGKTSDALGIFPDKNERERFFSTLRDQRIVHGMEMKCRVKSGEIRACIFSSGLIQMAGTPHILSTIGDLTEYKAAEVERTRMEQELRKSQQRLAEAMDLAHLVNWECDLRTNIFTFDDRFYAMYGTTAEREGNCQMPVETYAREFVHPLDREMVAEEVEKAKKTTDPRYRSQREHRIIRRDGRIRHIVVQIGVIKDASGRTIKTYGANQDITERKEAEEALRESEARYKEVADNAQEWIWEVDEEGLYRHSSPAVEKILGYSPEELVGKLHFYDLFAPDVREELKAKALALTRSHEAIRNLVNPNIHKNNSRVILETSGIPVYDANGTFAGYRGTDLDITGRKLAEDRLTESEEKFHSLVETSPNIIWEIDMKGKIRYISSSVVAILGYTPEELVGKATRDLITDEGKSVSRQAIAQIKSSGNIPSSIEIPVRHRDGHRVILEIRPSRTGVQGVTNGFRGVAIDITERRKTEEALRLVNRKLNLLAGITRHDILNKISVVLGFLKIAKLRYDDPALAELLNKMESATTVIRSQIEFTKLYQDLGTQAPQWIAPDRVMPRSQVPATISLNAAVQGITVFADPMFEKVFTNLLDNSLMHGERVTEVRVSSHKEGNVLIVVWEDNGIGIALGDKERIFEKGFGKHTGLGLFLVREILSLTGITITENGVPGTGARFEIRVPDGAYRICGE